MENRSLVTIAEHSKEKILYMLEMAKQFEMNPNRRLLQGKVVATLFFEPSTRTRLSFETAANRLGARVIGFSDPKATSSSKGETLKDTIMMVSNYADIIVMRHYLEGAARYASEVAPVPIVNAGDGANQHPSQTMLDLYSIYKTQGTLENLNIFLVGDLKYGRTVHSLLMAMRHFNPTFHFIAPEELKMPEEYKLYCKTHQIKYVEHTDFTEEIIADADILYMTRVQRERFTDLMEYERVKNVYILRNKMLENTRPNLRILFFEPSTRTRLSFETAANRLGARVIGFSDPKATSSSKGETLKDTIMMVSNYADIIVMRHYLEGAARYASEVAPVPIVNAGDGANQHPSQTMLDLYSIYKTQGTLENLNIFLVGDLKYGRTVHSLLMAMRHFNPTFHFIAPEELKMPEEYKLYCKTHQIKYVEHTDFTEEIIADADILYMTRVQRERFTDLMEYERVKNVYILRNKMLENTRPNLRILHPLPRVNEIAYDVDDNPKAYYFQQAQNGLYAREAILCDVLGITLDDVKNDILL